MTAVEIWMIAIGVLGLVLSGSNLVVVVKVIFTAGAVVQTQKDHGRRLDKVEEKVDTFASTCPVLHKATLP